MTNVHSVILFIVPASLARLKVEYETSDQRRPVAAPSQPTRLLDSLSLTEVTPPDSS